MASVRQPLSRAVTRSNQPSYICRTCQSRALTSRPDAHQQRGYASKQNLPFTEKLRRKIWGTDNPPGLADPYGGPSFLERRRMQREGKTVPVVEEENSPDARRRAQELAEQELLDSEALEDDSTVRKPRRKSRRKNRGEPEEPEEPEIKPYVPAETTKGLRHIGHQGHWRDLDPQPQDEYVPWINPSSKPVISKMELLSCLHQAIVECMTCKQAGIDTAKVFSFNSEEADSNTYATAKLHLSESGIISRVEFASEADEQQLVGLLSAEKIEETNTDEKITEETQTDEIIADGTTAKETVADEMRTEQLPLEEPSTGEMRAEEVDNTWNEVEIDEQDLATEIAADAPMSNAGVFHYDVTDESFLASRLSLQDPYTFTMLKRFTQLSGHRIPDHVLSTILSGNEPPTFSLLLDRLYTTTVKPKPKKLANVLMERSALAFPGNVMVLPRRETPIDKEKEVGRWKIIERELIDRGLPLLSR